MPASNAPIRTPVIYVSIFLARTKTNNLRYLDEAPKREVEQPGQKRAL